MKIQYASDLHLEFPENRKFLEANPLETVGDVLVLAGDIVPFAVMDQHNDFFNYISDHFEKTWWIPGNHEYYYFDLATKCGMLNDDIRQNVHLVNNTTVTHQGIRFVFSTLWTKISETHRWRIQRDMSDFEVIRYHGKRFTTDDCNQLHQESLKFVTRELEQVEATSTMVVTHHVPTFLNYPEQYKGDALNEGFAVELYDLIEANGPQYWLYGHHHSNIPDFEIGKTKMITNQLGYVRYRENQGYSPNKYVVL